jgi:hypothetical protein
MHALRTTHRRLPSIALLIVLAGCRSRLLDLPATAPPPADALAQPADARPPDPCDRNNLLADSQNCGDCGNRCAGDARCVAGGCADTCPPADVPPVEWVPSATSCADGWCDEGRPAEVLAFGDVFGFGANDVWVAATFVKEKDPNRFHGGMCHFDGSRWRCDPLPGALYVFGVWGAAPNDLWADGVDCAKRTLLFRRDGDSFRVVGSPDSHLGWQVRGTAATDVWIPARDRVFRFDGARWTSTVLGAPDPAGRAVWPLTSTEAWLVGWTGGSGLAPPLLLHWHDQQWTSSPIAQSGGLVGVWASAFDDVWVVGTSGAGRYPVFHFDGRAFSHVPTPLDGVPTDFTNVFGTSAKDVWATGTRGELVHWDGTGWSLAHPPASENTIKGLQGIWGTGNEFWAAGGTILHRRP